MNKSEQILSCLVNVANGAQVDFYVAAIASAAGRTPGDQKLRDPDPGQVALKPENQLASFQ